MRLAAATTACPVMGMEADAALVKVTVAMADLKPRLVGLNVKCSPQKLPVFPERSMVVPTAQGAVALPLALNSLGLVPLKVMALMTAGELLVLTSIGSGDEPADSPTPTALTPQAAPPLKLTEGEPPAASAVKLLSAAASARPRRNRLNVVAVIGSFLVVAERCGSRRLT